VTHALLELKDEAALSTAYRSLSGEDYRNLSVSELYSLERFSRDQMNCPARDTAAVFQPVTAPVPLKLGADGSAYAGPPTFIDENQCVWARVRYRNLQQDANSGTFGFDEDATGVSGGVQWAWNGPWYGGVAFGYENSEIDSGSVFSADGDRYRVAGSLKYIAGPWYVGGAITGNWSNFDSARLISFPGFASVATSDQDFNDIGGHLRVAYEVNRGSWYWKPMVDLNVTNVDMDSFTEKGGNGAALRVSSTDETVFSATPALEIGNQWVMANGGLVRPYVRGGVSFYSDAEFPIAASFAATNGAAPFTTNGEVDDVLGDVSAGVTFMSVAGSVLNFSYDGRFGDTIEEHSASAKASVKF
jgi:outer membrane autotransporter protein